MTTNCFPYFNEFGFKVIIKFFPVYYKTYNSILPGEYMMKKISSRSDWLPLRLFQRSFEDIHVLLPIMLMQIPKSYLHVRPCLSRLANQANRLQDKIATLPNTWFSTYKYPFIQNGAAELIVIGPPEKNCWERSLHYFLTFFFYNHIKFYIKIMRNFKNNVSV
jgi:hypothetical protein